LVGWLVGWLVGYTATSYSLILENIIFNATPLKQLPRVISLKLIGQILKAWW